MNTTVLDRRTQDWQAADARHHLHPFTHYQSLAKEGSRVITRAEGAYLWDSGGNRLLDGMAGLWCVNVGYGRRELADANVLVEQWGGDVVSVEVSAKQKTGIDDLLDMILLTADMLDLKANPEMSAKAVVLEAKFQGTGEDVYGVEKTLFRVQGEIEWGPTRVEITADITAVRQ